MRFNRPICSICGGLLAIIALPTASMAQDFTEIDALSDIATNEQAGITEASEQAAKGDLLEALATLERVLAVHPKSQGARLLHAVYLCDIDDKQGGIVALNQLKTKEIGEEALSAAYTRCGGELPE